MFLSKAGTQILITLIGWKHTACLSMNLYLNSYRDQIRDSRFRICLTRLKLSSHDLAIERVAIKILQDKNVFVTFVL